MKPISEFLQPNEERNALCTSSTFVFLDLSRPLAEGAIHELSVLIFGFLY